MPCWQLGSKGKEEPVHGGDGTIKSSSVEGNSSFLSNTQFDKGKIF